MTKYTSTSVSNYNSNPPSDDGSQTESNKVKWATIKSKLGDPLNSFASSVDTNVSAAFDKVFLASVEAQSSNFTISSNEDGRAFICTGSIAVTLPASADVYTGFVAAIKNDGSGTLTVSPDGSDTISGGASLSIPAGFFSILVNNGTDWEACNSTPPDNSIDETKLKDALINDYADTTITASDEILFGDADDSNNVKKDTVQGILDLVPEAELTIVQRVYAEVSSTTSGTAQIPWDDTIPQNSEGIEAITAAITPTSATNKLRIFGIVNMSAVATNNEMIAALFQDSTASALAATSHHCNNTERLQPIPIHHEMVAGTTSETTFKIRAGSSASVTCYFNSTSAGRKLGGVLKHTIIIEEISV